MSTRMGVRIQVDPSCCWGIDKALQICDFTLIDEVEKPPYDFQVSYFRLALHAD